MKYLSILLLLCSCATVPPKKGCTITKRECPTYAIESSTCTFTFDDDSKFYLPKQLADYFKVGENMCKE